MGAQLPPSRPTHPAPGAPPELEHEVHPHGLAAAVAAGLVRFRLPLLILAAVLVAGAWFPASGVRFERSIESMYAAGSPRLADYRQSKRLFGGDEFVLVAWEEQDPLSPDGLEAIRAFGEELSDVPGVNPASTQDLWRVFNPPGSGFAFRLVLRLRREELLELSRGVLIGGDDRTVAVILRLEAPPDGDERDAAGESADADGDARAVTFRRIRALAESHDPPAAVAGEPIQVHDAFEAVETDGRVLFWYSLAMLGAVLAFLFRSLRWVLLPLAVTVAAITWTNAVLVLSGARLSMVSSMLNSLVSIVGVATVSHVAVRYLDVRTHAPDLPKAEALRVALAELLSPVFWSCATTGAGFLSLLAAELTPVRSFGLMMSLGVAAVLAAFCLVVPGGAGLGRFDRDPRAVLGAGLLTRTLLGTAPFVLRHRVPFAAATAALVVLSVLGVLRLEVETDFSKNFREDSPIVRSLDFIEERLGGAGSWEVNFPVPPAPTAEDGGGEDGEPFDPTFLDEVREFATELRDLEVRGTPAVTKVVALTDSLDLMPNVPFGDNSTAAKLGRLADFAPEVEPSLYHAGERRMRVVLRGLERQPSARKRAVIERVQELGEARFGEAKTTGLFVLLTYLIESLLRDQAVSFAWAAAGIFAMLLLAFRSLRLAVASLLPNLLPIGVVLGGMGWAGVPVNIGTAMIASVSVGLTVDGNVHLLTGYLAARRAGLSRRDALAATLGKTGRAVLFATAALSGGFLVLTASQFVPLIYFGVLVSLAMAGGLAANLVLLPLFLGWREAE